MATVNREANLGFFDRFMRAYGSASLETRAELYRDTQAYSYGRETDGELYTQVTQLLGVPIIVPA